MAVDLTLVVCEAQDKDVRSSYDLIVMVSEMSRKLGSKLLGYVESDSPFFFFSEDAGL
jgi:hypothetical protein